jgi:anti-sigma regulatory factor (Ser/Thr protein kinase)
MSLAQTCGMSEARTGVLALIITECGTNLVKYAKNGEMILREYDEPGQRGVEILAVDQGPGMPNTEVFRADGYSTGGSLGLGLGGIARLSTEHGIYSVEGMGTVIWSRVCSDSTAPQIPQQLVEKMKFAGLSTPKPGQDACGDRWAVRHAGGALWATVIDGLGHGPLAGDAAVAALKVFHEVDIHGSPQEVLRIVHQQLKGTRGAVMAVAAINPAIGQIEYAGIGNISAMLADGQGTRRLPSLDGTLGYSVRTFRQQSYGWRDDATLILASDGISSRWHLGGHAGLLSRHPSILTTVVHRDFGRMTDDTTILAVKGPLL